MSIDIESVVGTIAVWLIIGGVVALVGL